MKNETEMMMTTTPMTPEQQLALRNESVMKACQDLRELSAALGGILLLLERRAQTSEVALSAYCLLKTLKQQFDQVLGKMFPLH